MQNALLTKYIQKNKRTDVPNSVRATPSGFT